MMIKIFEKFNEPVKREKYYDNGQKWYESWYLNGKLHREDGPTHQEWYSNGQKKTEYWRLNSKLHREDGPAYQWWFYNGQKENEEYWLNGKWYSKEDWVEELGKIGSPHYEEQLLLLNIEKYNL